MITLEEFKKKHSDKCRLIGLDLGSKRIGISICDEKQLIATPLKTINKNSLIELIDELKKIINENDIKGVVIGNPLNMDGSVGTRAKEVDAFAQTLEKRFGLPVHKVDERLTTHAAKEEILAVHGRRPERSSGELDSAAATLILRDFLEERSPAILPDPEGPDLDHP